MYKRILVPVDGSKTSDIAIQEAIKLAGEQQATLRFIHVLEEIYMLYTEGFLDVASLQAAVREQGNNMLSKAAALAKQASITYEYALLDAHGERTARVIVEDARQWSADVIVMGTHGRRGFDHMIFGSVAEGVVRLSAVPVLLIRGGAER